MTKTWFITGASKGFGREWAIAALERGDNVAATARDTSTLDDLAAKYGDQLLAQQLDVTDRAAVFATVQAAHEHFGGLDIIVNNAGYGQFGMVEEISEAERPRQIETNLFGALWVTQAALPFLRAQGCGHILQVSSIGGVVAFPNVGMYHASKWGARRHQPGPRPGGRRLRHQGHAHRAHRVLDRLGRPVRASTARREPGLRRRAREGAARPGPSG